MYISSIAQYPVLQTAQSYTLYFPGRSVQSNIQPRRNLCVKVVYIQISTTVYSQVLIHTAIE